MIDTKPMYHDKIVIITGASGGIGHYLAEEFAERGAHVYAVDIVRGAFSHPRITPYQLDLADSSQVALFFRNVVQENGKPHILINNGAIANFNKSVFEISDEEFKQVIDVNLCGAFYCARAFLHANQGEENGRIINIASTRWLQNEAGWDAYGASKGGLVSLTTSMAVSLRNTPVTVNAISPGWIECGDYKNLRDVDHLQHPSGRVGKPDDIVRTALFLCDPANDFINGENIVVDGGMTKRMFYAE